MGNGNMNHSSLKNHEIYDKNNVTLFKFRYFHKIELFALHEINVTLLRDRGGKRNFRENILGQADQNCGLMNVSEIRWTGRSQNHQIPIPDVKIQQFTNETFFIEK